MPIAHIYILKGRRAEQKRRVIADVSTALARALGSPVERIRVLIHEIAPEDWGIGDEAALSVSSLPSLPPLDSSQSRET